MTADMVEGKGRGEGERGRGKEGREEKGGREGKVKGGEGMWVRTQGEMGRVNEVR